MATLAQPGVTALPGSAEVFTSFDRVARSGPDTVFHGIGNGGTEGIYGLLSGVLETVADTATPVPGIGSSFVGFGVGPAFRPDEVVFHGKYAGGEGIYRIDESGLGMVVDTNTLVPETAGRTFEQFLASWRGILEEDRGRRRCGPSPERGDPRAASPAPAAT